MQDVREGIAEGTRAGTPEARTGTWEAVMSRRRIRWRVQSDNDGSFDEIVVGSSSNDGLILHAEHMGNSSYFIDVAGICIWAFIDSEGRALIASSEDRREGSSCAEPIAPSVRRPKMSGQSCPAEGATMKKAAKKSTKSATKTKTVKRAPAKTAKRAAKGGSRK